MTIEYMRDKIAEVYPGVGWKYRCRNMPDKQVIAIYKSFSEKGVFSKKKAKKRQQEPAAKQVTLFDYAKTLGVRL